MSEAELEIEMSSVVELESDEVLSVSELVEEFKVSSVPPLHEMIVRLTKKMIKMTKIFFTFLLIFILGEKINSRNYFVY